MHIFLHFKGMRSSKGEWKKYVVSHSLLTVSLLLVAGLLELCPSRKSEFLEGDMTISHTCGNTVRLSFCEGLRISIPMVLLYYLLTVLLLIALIFIFVNRVNQWKVRKTVVHVTDRFYFTVFFFLQEHLAVCFCLSIFSRFLREDHVPAFLICVGILAQIISMG